MDEATYARLRANPMVSVCDLEQAITAFFGIIRSRDLEEFLVPVKTFAVTWKTAPKVSG